MSYHFKIKENTYYTRWDFTVLSSNQREHPLYALGFHSTEFKPEKKPFIYAGF